MLFKVMGILDGYVARRREYKGEAVTSRSGRTAVVKLKAAIGSSGSVPQARLVAKRSAALHEPPPLRPEAAVPRTAAVWASARGMAN